MSDNNKRTLNSVYSESAANQPEETNVIKVFSGDCYVTDKPHQMMVTVLGSCIAACIRDPNICVGGMNHFLLPDGTNAADAPLRYGAYSMEKLINDILKLGGRRERLEVKVFGGGNVIESSAKIGDKNVKFIRDYLLNEGIRIAQEDLGGKSPRRIHYFPDTGKAMMKKIRSSSEVEEVKKEEKQYRKKIESKVSHENESNVELF
jgi:chemotaxis protein CheD